MMSQIVMSTSIPPFGLSTLISFFETFAPRVEMYWSSNWSWMNLRIRHVLPTAPSPTRQILTFIFWRSIGIPRGGSSLAHVSGYKGVAHRLSIEIMAGPPGPKAGIGQSLPPGPMGSPRARDAPFTPAPGFAGAGDFGALWSDPNPARS